MTYKHCVFKPGPRINLVIGPNGVGKSSILCAVVLGLGGKPKLLGRQKLLANFVRRVDLNASNTDRAVIRITLKADPDDPSMDQDPMIERSFARGSSVSKWKINNKNSNQTEVDKIVVKEGVKIMGETNILNKLPVSASNLYSKNVLNFVTNLYDKENKKVNINLEDEIIEKTLIK
jgi:chromosome segregation ATPase